MFRPRGGREGRTAARTPGSHVRERQEAPFVVSLVEQWWDRLISAVFSGTLADQTARYAAHRTKRDYLFNSVGLGLWGALFPLLTMIASQLVGTEQAGMFSMAFVYANLIQFVGMYGVRTYQVSDVDEMDSFGAYQLQRLLSCLLMVGVGYLFCRVRGYSGEMLSICTGTFAFRTFDAFADVYEGRLQQMDKLWLAGISQGLRCTLGVASFTLALVITRDVAIASIVMAVVALASLLMVSIPLTYFETPRSRSWEFLEIREIFAECFPTFLATFLFSLIETVPKFAMEGTLPYDDQLFFNAIYFPAQAIAMALGLVYKPQLVRLANIWADPNHRRRFDLVVIAIVGVGVGICAIVFAFNSLFGVPILSVLYGTDFASYKTDLLMMVVAGGMTAVVDFLYQIITVLRRQEVATRIYLLTFGIATVLALVLVNTIGFAGAVWTYLLSMATLFVLLIAQYVVLRVKG